MDRVKGFPFPTIISKQECVVKDCHDQVAICQFALKTHPYKTFIFYITALQNHPGYFSLLTSSITENLRTAVCIYKI